MASAAPAARVQEDMFRFTLRLGLFRFSLIARQPLLVPALNKGNMLRGGFGHAFRKLCCVPQCRDASSCPLETCCPYKAIFAPSPPPGSEQLSKNQDIPRPFVFRPPLTQQTSYAPGERFEFELTLIGRAIDHLPYFVLSFRELADAGLGLNRARCSLDRVEEVGLTGGAVASTNEGEEGAPRAVSDIHRAAHSLSPSYESRRSRIIYTAEDQTFRPACGVAAEDWIETRIRELTSNFLFAFRQGIDAAAPEQNFSRPASSGANRSPISPEPASGKLAQRAATDAEPED